MNDKQMAKADFIISILLILGSLFIMLYTVFGFPHFPGWGGLYSNPGFVPFLLGLSLLILSSYLLTRSLKRQGQEIRMTSEGVNRFFHQQKVIRFLICLGLFVLYYILLGRLPFLIVTTLYLFLSFHIFGRGKWMIELPIAVVISLIVYLSFTRIFLIPLP